VHRGSCADLPRPWAVIPLPPPASSFQRQSSSPEASTRLSDFVSTDYLPRTRYHSAPTQGQFIVSLLPGQFGILSGFGTLWFSPSWTPLLLRPRGSARFFYIVAWSAPCLAFRGRCCFRKMCLVLTRFYYLELAPFCYGQGLGMMLIYSWRFPSLFGDLSPGFWGGRVVIPPRAPECPRWN